MQWTHLLDTVWLVQSMQHPGLRLSAVLVRKLSKMNDIAAEESDLWRGKRVEPSQWGKTAINGRKILLPIHFKNSGTGPENVWMYDSHGKQT